MNANRVSVCAKTLLPRNDQSNQTYPFHSDIPWQEQGSALSRSVPNTVFYRLKAQNASQTYLHCSSGDREKPADSSGYYSEAQNHQHIITQTVSCLGKYQCHCSHTGLDHLQQPIYELHFLWGTQARESCKHELSFGCSRTKIGEVRWISLRRPSVRSSTAEIRDSMSWMPLSDQEKQIVGLRIMCPVCRSNERL